MNSTWSDYVAMVMAKEMLAELGDTESHIVFEELSCKENPLFESFLNKQGSDSKDKEHIRGIWNLINQPVDDRFLHYSGKVNGPFGIVCKCFEVVVNGECQRIATNDHTKLQKNYFAANEDLHIFAEREKDRTVARYVLSDSAMAAMRYYQGAKLGSFAIEGFLRLSSQRQAAYCMLATNKSLRRTVLYASAYLATKAIMDQSFSAETVRRAADAFNSTICAKVHCDRIKPSLFALYAQDLYESKQTDLSTNAFLLQVDSSFNTIKKLLPLSFFAIIGGFSAWHAQGLSTTQIIVEKLVTSRHIRVATALSTMAHPKLVASVLTELIEAAPNYPQHADDICSLLFSVLRWSKCLSDDMICRISDYLFRDKIYQEQTQHMYDVLSGPNGACFRNYVMDGYNKACGKGIAEFHFCAAAIVNAERHHAEKNALRTAIKEISKASTASDYLLNVLCLGLLAWDGKVGKGNYTEDIKELTLEEATVHKLVSYLSTPDKLFFPIVACAIHDLILRDVLNADILEEPQRHAAIQALADEDIRKRSEELLSLIELPDAVQPTAANTEPLLRKYLARYEACHQDPESDEDCEVLLAVLCHLGEFPSLEEKREQLNRVLLRSATSKVRTGNDNKWRIGHLVRAICLRPHLWTVCTTDIAPAILDQELTEEAKQALTDLSKELAKENRLHHVTDTREAVDIIKFITPYTYDILTQKHPVPVSLGKHIVMEVPNPGSFIINNWFGILCRYAKPEQVLIYYRAYHEVLDRPASMIVGCRTLAPENALYNTYKTYMCARSRVREGIYAAVISGNLDVLSAFMDSEFRYVVDNQEFAESLLKDNRISGMETALVSIYEKRHGTDTTHEAAKGDRTTASVNMTSLIAEANRLIKERSHRAKNAESDVTEESFQSDLDLIPEASEWRADLEDCSLQHAVHKELEFSPTRYYDDLAIQCYTLFMHPKHAYLVMMLGYHDDYDLMKYAVSVNGTMLKYASPRLQEDKEICLIALQQTGLALPYVKNSIRDDSETIIPLLLASDCVLGGIPQQYRENPDIVMKAVMRDPTQLQYAAEALCASRDIVAAAISREQRATQFPSVVKWASEDLRDDKDLMIHALRANPQAYTYLSSRLKEDPEILAMEHVDQLMDDSDLLMEIRRILAQLQ